MKKLLLSLLLLFYVISLWAQQDQEELEVYDLFDVSLEDLLNIGIVTASQKEQSVSDAPATAHVLTREQIQLRGYQNLVDLLEDIPEIEFQRNSNPDYKNIGTIRGISGNEKFIVMLDGIRITPATGDKYILGTNFSLINAQRVEIILGPASALYGVDAFSGIINIITQKDKVSSNVSGQANLSYGQFETQEGSFSLSTKVDKLELSLAGHYYESQEPDLNRYYENEFRWYNERYIPHGQLLISPALQYITAVRGELESEYAKDFENAVTSHFFNVNARYKDLSVGYTRHYESHSSAVGVRSEFGLRDKDAQMKMSMDAFHASHQFNSFNKKWSLKSTLTHSVSELHPSSSIIGSLADWVQSYRYERQASTNIEEQFHYDFSSKVSLIVGASFADFNAIPRTAPMRYELDKSIPPEFQEIHYIGTDSLFFALPSQPNGAAIDQRIFNLSYQNVGAYSQVQINPIKWLNITLGSRFDYNTRYGRSINPRVGLVFNPVEKMRFKLLYGTAFLSPSPNKAFEHFGAFDPFTIDGEIHLRANFFHFPNAELEPERIQTAEASASYFITPNLAFSINGFYNKADNLISTLGDFEFETFYFGQEIENVILDEAIIIEEAETTVNLGDTEIYGGTTQLKYLKKIGFHSLQSDIAYSYTDGKLDNDRLLLTAKHSLKGGVSISHKKYGVSLRFRYQSPTFSQIRDGDEGDFLSNKAYTVFNLAAHYQFYDKHFMNIKAFTRIQNLLDTRYYHAFAGGAEGMPATPQDPRRIQVGLRVGF